MPFLQDHFLEVVSQHTAGDPQREEVIWTCLSLREIAQHLDDLGTPVGRDTVRVLLEDHGFARRHAEKRKAMGQAPFRNEQFEKIATLQAEYFASSANPILSMDTKKKEWLGDFFRAGSAWSTGSNTTWDHDFTSYATGRVIPHGVYDLKRNAGHLTLGTSHDTSEFACDSLRQWWRRCGRRAYPRARSILLLCDAGGSNHCRHHLFKEDLQRLVNELGISIRVAHYPPHCSKYNPIEHRLFPHVTRAWSGVVFRSWEIVVRSLERARTRTGLRVVTTVLDQVYQLRRKASQAFLQAAPILYDARLPDWNYTVIPTSY